MVQGTQSDAGKSVLVTALCRWLFQQGVSVAPYKPQNMALNSAVAVNGGEIGRAQAIQAAACELEPHTDMNPILLKPNSDTGSQVIIHGRPVANLDARAYHDYKPVAKQFALEGFRRLAARHDVIVVEGAGSPAEINLRARDIANMGFAEAVDCPVVLVGDIDRGGVFAQCVGTMEILSEAERERIVGFIINKFRGDVSLLQPGLQWLQQRTGKPVLGVMPFVTDLHHAAEDSFFDPSLGNAGDAQEGERFRVVVPRLSRLSNHTDFDPLRLHPEVELIWVAAGKRIPPADLIILPGSKSTRADLAWLKRYGWPEAIAGHLRYGGRVVGICGGFQMLGNVVHDPDGVEGAPGSSRGLGFLEMETLLTGEKRVVENRGRLAWCDAAVKGYEIHAGVSTGAALAEPSMILEEGDHGALSEDGLVFGSYLHGLMDQPDALAALLEWAGMDRGASGVGVGIDVVRHQSEEFDRLARTLQESLDMDAIGRILGISVNKK
ncbi:MAG: cobyric acid synthase [Magnetococcales bacterium]|nr:cobyric acid synthase [Magnetococcales bacterium]